MWERTGHCGRGAYWRSMGAGIKLTCPLEHYIVAV